jgi:predicted ArsR family transcriptional regulator
MGTAQASTSDRRRLRFRSRRALSDPTRHDIFRCVADADEPVDVAELTGQIGPDQNGIRQHLAEPVEAEPGDEPATPAVGGRGRPRLIYGVAPTVERTRRGYHGVGRSRFTAQLRDEGSPNAPTDHWSTNA